MEGKTETLLQRWTMLVGHHKLASPRLPWQRRLDVLWQTQEAKFGHSVKTFWFERPVPLLWKVWSHTAWKASPVICCRLFGRNLSGTNCAGCGAWWSFNENSHCNVYTWWLRAHPHPLSYFGLLVPLWFACGSCCSEQWTLLLVKLKLHSIMAGFCQPIAGQPSRVR